MNIYQIVIYCIILYSITNIIVNGDIFFNVRQFFFEKDVPFFRSVLTCTTCLSVWIGFVMSLFFIVFTNIKTPAQIMCGCTNIATVFFDGMFASGVVGLIQWVSNFKK